MTAADLVVDTTTGKVAEIRRWDHDRAEFFEARRRTINARRFAGHTKYCRECSWLFPGHTPDCRIEYRPDRLVMIRNRKGHLQEEESGTAPGGSRTYYLPFTREQLAQIEAPLQSMRRAVDEVYRAFGRAMVPALEEAIPALLEVMTRLKPVLGDMPEADDVRWLASVRHPSFGVAVEICADWLDDPVALLLAFGDHFARGPPSPRCRLPARNYFAVNNPNTKGHRDR